MTRALPEWPAMRRPFLMRPGNVPDETAPPCRNDSWLPWESLRVGKPWRFTTPVKPRPLLVPITSTCWPAS